MNTQESNKLIAEFLGFRKAIVSNEKGRQCDYNLPKGFELIKETETTIEGEWCEILVEQDYCMVSDLKFHSSWDWLMPVVGKIESLDSAKWEGFSWSKTPFSVKIEAYGCEIEIDRGSTENTQFSVFNTGSKIETVYKAVLEFILWVNENRWEKYVEDNLNS